MYTPVKSLRLKINNTFIVKYWPHAGKLFLQNMTQGLSTAVKRNSVVGFSVRVIFFRGGEVFLSKEHRFVFKGDEIQR